MNVPKWYNIPNLTKCIFISVVIFLFYIRFCSSWRTYINSTTIRVIVSLNNSPRISIVLNWHTTLALSNENILDHDRKSLSLENIGNLCFVITQNNERHCLPTDGLFLECYQLICIWVSIFNECNASKCTLCKIYVIKYI